MHRTQILLEDEQYGELREQARRAGTSLGALIRGLVDDHLKSPKGKLSQQRAALRRLKGAFRGKPLSGRDHDRDLY